MRSRAVFLLVALAVVLTAVSPAGAQPELEFLGEEILPTGLQFEDTEVGGLSSMAYDAELDRYYVISDDQSVIDPARFYTFDLDVADGDLDPGDVVVADVTTLLDAGGLPFAAASFDPEGLALTRDRELVITSEGIATRLI
ncbi:MAG: esterase-like activity of phytase family protein, partial [Gaiellaceae bacterium]